LVTVGWLMVDWSAHCTRPLAFSAIDECAEFADQTCRRFGEQIAADKTSGWNVAGFRHDEQVAGPRCCYVNDSTTLCVEVATLGLPDAQARWFLPREPGKIYHPTATIAFHTPGPTLRAGIPPTLTVPDCNDRKLKPFGLVNSGHLNRFGSDRMRRVELDGTFHPLSESRGRGIVIKSVVRCNLLHYEAQFAQPGQSLGSVCT
jgi:hypothetical protein